jgi:glycosyltransferase involved in cell wall biosynthesis
MNRKRIMLSFQYDENWIGGTYYIVNIIKALNQIDDRDKPMITILHNMGSPVTEIEKIKYPYLEYLPFTISLPFLQSKINRLGHIFTSKTFFTVKLPKPVDNFYPANNDVLDLSNIANYYTWIGDFQEHYLPQFFTKAEVNRRKFLQRQFVNLENPVVFSSQNALDDFNKFYPGHKNKKAILRFASVIGTDYKSLDIDKLREKYAITKPYFIVTNQFWKHKNHATAIKAFEKLVKSESNVQLVLTGKESDYRNPGYPEKLKKSVLADNPDGKILFLGFLPRNEQLKLMEQAIAIIQPSLFEGWSTVVEDAKALGQFIVLSSLPIHKEQISTNCLFFEPFDVEDLAEKMRILLKERPKVVPVDYQQAIRVFAYAFLSLFEKGKDEKSL